MIKRIIFGALMVALFLFLSGCAALAPLLTGVPAPAPAQVANTIKVDEAAANAAHTAFEAWHLAINVALDAGLHGSAATAVLEYDKKVRTAYDAAQDAYHAANATSFAAAVAEMHDAIVAGSAVIKTK